MRIDMNRRRSLQCIGMLGIIFMFSHGFFAPLLQPPVEREWNTWNGTQFCHIASLFTPSSQEELTALVQTAYQLKKKMKVIGAGHSLNAIAVPDPETWTVSLENYAQILEVNLEEQTITVQGGATLSQINDALDFYGLSLENLGSISDQTIGGVFQTGTHGTGQAYGPLHTQILSMTLINGKGDLIAVSPTTDPLLFRAGQCGLGALGIINTITLRAIPARFLCERTYSVPWPDLLDQLDLMVQNNAHVRAYWFPYTGCAGVWTANPTTETKKSPALIKDSEPFFRLVREMIQETNDPTIQSMEDVLALGPSNPQIIARFNRALFEVDYGQPYERSDRSDRIFNVDCSVHRNCCAMEAAFPAHDLKPFLLELQALIETRHFPAHTGVEIRFVKSDSAFLSPTYSASPNDLFCFVSVVSIRAGSYHYEPFFQAFEALVEAYRGRLHWGKLGRFSPSYLREVYPEWEAFLLVRQQADPSGMFLNDFTQRLVYPK